MPNVDELKALLLKNDPAFWEQLATASRAATSFDEVLFLSNLRKKAVTRGLVNPRGAGVALRLALIGGSSLYPLRELVEHQLAVAGFAATLFAGEFNNYVSEILDEKGELYAFRPQVVVLLPSERGLRYPGSLIDTRARQHDHALSTARELLELATRLNERSGAEVLLANFILPARHDLGPYRAKTAGSEWSYRKLVNLELGFGAPSFVHVLDLEFLASRRGNLASRDERMWFESKQPCAPDLMVDVAREIAQMAGALKRASKKVLVLDLDNTLWGGVIGDDGLEGIELGDTSARGEAFKAFQKYVLSLAERGVLLAVASKNDHDKALEPFQKHPDMVLKPEHIVSFKANWDPKSDNIRAMAGELNLGLDSFVFVDDNPAEIDIVRQFVPEVATIHLSADPSEYVALLQDSRYFEPSTVTKEDLERTQQYRADALRNQLRETVTDMNAYLKSLEMTAVVSPFTAVDAPRISQLINKSNQFNLTTRRRTEGEVAQVAASKTHDAFTIRLADKFGDHGLIAVVVLETRGKTMEVDTWLMSCRVLKRQVEELTVGEIVKRARARGVEKIVGTYLPTAKNQMVADLYPKMGFTAASQSPEKNVFELKLGDAKDFQTHIQVKTP